jgi:hypothetical protein
MCTVRHDLSEHVHLPAIDDGGEPHSIMSPYGVPTAGDGTTAQT